MPRQQGHIARMTHSTSSGQTKRATQRPKDFRKPAHWNNDPPPRPEAAKEGEDPQGLSPTRYGDWVHKGIAVDF